MLPEDNGELEETNSLSPAQLSGFRRNPMEPVGPLIHDHHHSPQQRSRSRIAGDLDAAVWVITIRVLSISTDGDAERRSPSSFHM
jgi:hypothetical protein